MSWHMLAPVWLVWDAESDTGGTTCPVSTCSVRGAAVLMSVHAALELLQLLADHLRRSLEPQNMSAM